MQKQTMDSEGLNSSVPWTSPHAGGQSIPADAMAVDVTS